MKVDGRGEHDHEGELEEEHAVEDEGLGFVPSFEALGDYIGAGIDGEGGEAGDCDGRELHCGEWCRGKAAGARWSGR